jgi:hypothetical protein
MTGPFTEIALPLFQGSRRWSVSCNPSSMPPTTPRFLARDIRRDAPPASSREHIIQEDRAP